MTILQSILLGIVQGLTEFLPVSSSAHLVIVPYLLGWTLEPDIAFVFDVLVQMGTLAAVIVYFWQDLWRMALAIWDGLRRRQPWSTAESRLGWLIALATIPAGVFGLLVKEQVEAAFGNPTAVAVFLFVTAVLLIIAEKVGSRVRALEMLNWKDALWIGAFQAFSVFPGISRSGSTISGAMLRNIQRPAAARFSFLMSIPIMVAAGGLALKDLLDLPAISESAPIIISGFLSAAVVGYLSIRWFLRFLSRHSLVGFAAYCILVGALVLIKRALT